MMSVLKVLGIAVAVGIALLWFVKALPPMPSFGIHDDPAKVTVVNPLPPADDGYTTLSGIVLYNGDRDHPAPYIAYELPEGGTRTKQLIFSGERGCSTASGDLPCAIGDAPTFPDYPEGTQITVTGTIVGDQILVERVATS